MPSAARSTTSGYIILGASPSRRTLPHAAGSGSPPRGSCSRFFSSCTQRRVSGVMLRLSVTTGTVVRHRFRTRRAHANGPNTTPGVAVSKTSIASLALGSDCSRSACNTHDLITELWRERFGHDCHPFKRGPILAVKMSTRSGTDPTAIAELQRQSCGWVRRRTSCRASRSPHPLHGRWRGRGRVVRRRCASSGRPPAVPPCRPGAGGLTPNGEVFGRNRFVI